MRSHPLAATAGSLEQRSRNRLSRRVAFAVAACVAALLLGVVPGAKAATPVDSYAPAGLPLFSVDPSRADTAGSGDLAVSSSTGNIFVPEHLWGNFVVFKPDAVLGGQQIAEAEVLGTAGVDPLSLAVDPSDDTVYASDSIYVPGLVKMVSDGQPTPSYTWDPSFAPSIFPPGTPVGATAVVPGTGDLLAVDPGNSRVVKLASSDGHELLSVGGFQNPWSLAAGPSGAFYVVDYAARRVESFAADGTPQADLPLPGDAQPSAITANAVTGEVAVAIQRHGQSYIAGFAADGTAKFTARITAAINPPSNAITGIAWDGGTGRIYVSTRSPGGAPGSVATFVPAAQPGVDAPAATAGRNTAHVSAEVAPGGGDETSARFEYCQATNPCDSYPISNPGDPSNPWKRGPEHSGLTTTTTIEDDLPLSSNATWKIRVSADDNVTHTDNTSDETTLDSPLLVPGVTAGPAASVTETQAELTGTIDTLGAQATYHFEYGLTTDYGSRVPAADSPAGDNRTPRAVSKLVTELQPGTTYHYRLVGHNSLGDGFSADRTFRTPDLDEAPPQRSYEQVTPVDKKGAQVASEFHVQMAPDGSWIAAATASGSSDSEANRMRQNYLIRREATDWSSWAPIDAPQNAAAGIFEASTTGVSPDGTHALVASNRDLAPGAFEGGGNLYDKDLQTGKYTFVAGAPSNDAYNQLSNGLANEVIYMGGAPDFSWILFWAPVSLSPDAPGGAIYRWNRSTGLSVESQVPDPFNPGQTMVSGDIQMPGAYQLAFPSSSADGKVVAFGTSGGVFRRVDGVTTNLSVSRRATDLGTQYPATLDGMTSDGRYVFFHSFFHLTEDTPEDIGGRNAGYRYDAQNDTLTYTMPVTATNPMVGMADDGSTVYYDTAENISVWHDGDVHTVTNEHPLGNGGGYYATDNGRYFAWTSKTGEQKVYLYELGANQRICVSCQPDGSSPKPAFIALNSRTIGNTMPRIVTEDGTMFFDTAARLVSADHNGRRDVYAYKDGRLWLISPGDESFDAVFVGATDGGRDVFFQTEQSLVSRDVDKSTDVYDARVGGGFPGQSPPPPAASCVRAECLETSSGPVKSPAVLGSLPATKGASKALSLSLGKVKFGKGSLRIRFHASGPGQMKVTGPQVRTASRKVSKAGNYSITVPLDKEARADLAAGKRLTVSVKATIRGGGESASAKYSRTLGK